MPDLLKLYHRFPYPLRVLAATARGAYLRGWRYGPETEQLVQAALEREAWTAEHWQAWQAERLGYLLHRAATQVPYYRAQWTARRRKGDQAAWEYVEHWPIIEKEALRAQPAAFVADDCNPRHMFHEHTSGTTGKSLDLWWSQATVRAWYALFEARCRRWYGVSRQQRWAILGGQLVTPVHQRQPPFWVWNAGLNQLYMSSYHLAPDLIPHYLDALVRHRIIYLWGYTSSLYALAQEIIHRKRRDLKLAVVITNAEPLFSYQREVIAEAFQCPVRETYGMAEVVAAASECEAGHLHLWPEVGMIELMQDGASSFDQAGEIVATGLINIDMPLIRYRVGDRGALSTTAVACSCGRQLPILSAIEGRVDDVLYTADGRSIGRLDPVFKAQLPVSEAQIIQEAINCFRVRYVPTAEFTKQAGDSIVERLQARLGQVEVILEEMSEVPREQNGKYRAVVSKLSAEERQAVRQKKL